MSAAYDVLTHLIANGHGQLSYNIGANAFFDAPGQADPPISYAVFEYSGLPDAMAMGGIACFEYPRIQIQVRGKQPMQIEATCRQIYNLMRGARDLTLNAHVYQYFEPVSTPTPLARDEQNRVTYMCQFQVHRSPE